MKDDAMYAILEIVKEALIFIFLVSVLVNTVNYIIYKLLENVIAKLAPVQRIQENSYSRDFFLHDLKSFWFGFPISMLYIYVLYKLWEKGILIFSMESISILQFIGQFIFLAIAFDFFYYWTHRIFHYEPLYSKIHLEHHINTAPTPMTTLTFNPIESFVVVSLFPIIGVLFGLHLYVVLAGLAAFGTYNQYVHAGYEFMAKDWHLKFPNKLFLTATVHDLHHSKFNYHFGAFTTIWDRLFGTIYPELGEYHHNVMTKVEKDTFVTDKGNVTEAR